MYSLITFLRCCSLVALAKLAFLITLLWTHADRLPSVGSREEWNFKKPMQIKRNREFLLSRDMTEHREGECGVHEMQCITEPPELRSTWLFPLIIYSVPFRRRTSFHISPSSLQPWSFFNFFFILAPLSVPWHSKALLPSLTLFHGAADDNNWFENWRQWQTRIIPGSHPLPPS